MIPTTSSTLRRLVISSILYIAMALIATGIAIAENRPAEFGGSSTGLTVTQDFLYGNGTAMSPASYWLVAEVILTILAFRQDRWGSVGIIGLTIFGLMFSIGMAGEPILLETFSPVSFNIINALIQAGMFILPLMMMVFGILEWLRRRKESLLRHQTPRQSISPE